ncbi:MAG: response regulator transcription factor [Anaerolineae bacterium]|nr:response regulator transcription factor [Phycisphaerae bacterium]
MSNTPQSAPRHVAGQSGSSAPRNNKRVLVVDDEKDLLDLLTYNLQRNGYDVVTSQNGIDALEVAVKEEPDLILLDLMLPGLAGTEVARRLKADPRTAQIPLVMLTAKGEETDVVVGLTLGADDYITKPFSMKILLARLSVVLRRSDPPIVPSDSVMLRAGPLSIDSSRHEASVNGEAMKLTLTEFKLLSALVQARGRVLSRDQLMDKAMGNDVFVTDRAIDVHVTAIRKKLGGASYLIHTVRGVGYKLQESRDEESEE